MITRAPAFRSVVLDVDSTLSGIEGVDWLAARRGDALAREVADLTRRSMQGTVSLEQVYGSRLSMIAPRRDEIDALARAYVDRVAHGAYEMIARALSARISVHLVSGGIRPALLLLAEDLGIAASNVHAVSVNFDATGAYVGYDEESPLTTSSGKRDVVQRLALEAPVLAVGDGVTDLVMRTVVDCFIAYTEFVTRSAVVDAADGTANSFADLESLIFA